MAAWHAEVRPTSTTFELDGVPVRTWTGTSPGGAPYHLFVHRVAWPLNEPEPWDKETLEPAIEPKDMVQTGSAERW